MKILISTGIYPPEIGGPAEYARQLSETLLIQNHEVSVVTYGKLKELSTGVRHVAYFFKLLAVGLNADYIITLDTFSVGLPAVIFAKLFRKKIVIRTGGDFLWEGYLDRTQEMILLPDFYTVKRKYTFKEKMIFSLTGVVLRNVDMVVFSTAYQREIFMRPYKLLQKKTTVIENFYPPVVQRDAPTYEKKVFLSPSRATFFKNKKNLDKAFEMAQKNHPDIVLDTKPVSREVLMEKIASAYAVLVPSLSEISPNLVMDSLQYSTPIILTSDNGIKNRIGDSVLYVDPLSTESIADGIEKMLDPYVYSEYKNKAKSFTYTHSWNEIAQEFLDLYTQL